MTINVRGAENLLYKNVINVDMYPILEDGSDRDEMP
jgi:hypothetical protein